MVRLKTLEGKSLNAGETNESYWILCLYAFSFSSSSWIARRRIFLNPQD